MPKQEGIKWNWVLWTLTKHIVVHRIVDMVKKNGILEGYITKGDNNKYKDAHFEEDLIIKPESILAKIYLGRGYRSMIKNFDQKIKAHELSIIGKDTSSCSVHPGGVGRVQKYGGGWIAAPENTKQKHYDCKICSKPFKYESNLIEHAKIHTL